MDRRGFLKGAGQVTVAGAVGAAMHPARALIGMLGGAPAGASGQSALIGLNYDAAGSGYMVANGIRMFKNGFREGGVGGATFDSSGWPNSNFNFEAFAGANTPSWATGTWKCGFIGTGSETIAAYIAGTVSNIVHGTGGAYTTFDMVGPTGNGTAGSASFGFSVSGVTGSITNVFAYLPAYPGSTIDDPTSQAALTTEIIDHYKNYGYYGLRWMWPGMMAFCSRQLTSTNRNSVSNTQTNYGWNGSNGTGPIVALSSSPGVQGGDTVTLAAAWPWPTGIYQIIWYTTSSTYATRFCNCTNGNATLTFVNTADTIGATEVPAASTNAQLGLEGYPIEWAVNLCNAANCSLRINTPWVEDGTNYSAGSWSNAVMTYVKNNWTSTGIVEFELGNENWNGNYHCKGLWAELTTLTGFANTSHYLAYRLNAFATLGRTIFGANWGSKFVQIYADQTNWGSDAPFYNTLSIYSTYGTIKSDLDRIDNAPYCNPTLGNTDSIATIQSKALAAAQTVTTGNSSSGNNTEIIAACGMHFGLSLGNYEGGFQWNSSQYSSVTNLGAAIMDSGFVPCIEAVYQSYVNSGIAKPMFHFQDDANYGAGSSVPTDSLSIAIETLETAPTPTGLKSFISPNSISITRNVITTPGAVINGYDYVGNNSNVGTAAPSLGGQYTTPILFNYGMTWLLYSAIARTVTLSANFTNSGGTGSTQLEYGNATNGYSILGGGTPTSISIPTGTNDVSIGSFPVVAGWNYIVLGNPTVAQSGITVNSLTCG